LKLFRLPQQEGLFDLEAVVGEGLEACGMPTDLVPDPRGQFLIRERGPASRSFQHFLQAAVEACLQPIHPRTDPLKVSSRFILQAEETAPSGEGEQVRIVSRIETSVKVISGNALYQV
jgi:hypothetical protein